jgi:hypothetical protein
MKKKLEAELISIAHRILKLKNKSELIQLHQETQKLYEKLSVLRFVEENFGDVKPTIGLAEIEDKIDAIYSKEETPTVVEDIVQVEEPKTEIETKQEPLEAVEVEKAEEIQETPEAVVEPEIIEEIQEEVVLDESHEEEQTAVVEEDAFKPAFELAFDSKSEEPQVEVHEEIKKEEKNKPSQISFEDLLGSNYTEPVFVKPEDVKEEKESSLVEEEFLIEKELDVESPVVSNKIEDEPKSVSLNDRLSKGISVGLNDRIAFIKHLFANSSEDYNRVLSQLITFDTFQEAQSFIDDMVKPDYNNWEGKEEYETRFMDVVEKKFS